MDYVCIGQLYPSSGVPGVLGVPVSNERAVARFHKFADIPEEDDVIFIRLTEIPESAQEWLLPGDVVCKYRALSEPFLDVLRKKDTVGYVSMKRGLYDFLEPLMPVAEDARREAIEEHRWAVRYEGPLLAVSDPQGRLAWIVTLGNGVRKLVRHIYFTKPATKIERETAALMSPLSVKKVQAMWITLKVFHEFMFDQEEMDGKAYLALKRGLPLVNQVALTIPDCSKDSDLFRLHTRRRTAAAKKFWGRIRREYLLKPDSLEGPLLRYVQRSDARWIRVHLDEMPGVLKYAMWPEWSLIKPPMHFSLMTNKDGGRYASN